MQSRGGACAATDAFPATVAIRVRPRRLTRRAHFPQSSAAAASDRAGKDCFRSGWAYGEFGKSDTTGQLPTHSQAPSPPDAGERGWVRRAAACVRKSSSVTAHRTFRRTVGTSVQRLRETTRGRKIMKAGKRFAPRSTQGFGRVAHVAYASASVRSAAWKPACMKWWSPVSASAKS